MLFSCLPSFPALHVIERERKQCEGKGRGERKRSETRDQQAHWFCPLTWICVCVCGIHMCVLGLGVKSLPLCATLIEHIAGLPASRLFQWLHAHPSMKPKTSR